MNGGDNSELGVGFQMQDIPLLVTRVFPLRVIKELQTTWTDDCERQDKRNHERIYVTGYNLQRCKEIEKARTFDIKNY